VIRKRDTGAVNVQIAECALGVHCQSRAIRFLTSFPAIVTSLSAGLGRTVMTRGVACLDADTVAQILDSVRTYYRFDEDIDPYEEHDIVPTHCREEGLLLEDRLLRWEHGVPLSRSG